ncbi:MAG: hypothetical protein IKI30_01195 [Oxalobacter sp.]|nr:hypothetical protein [Oxalobacter sp.]
MMRKCLVAILACMVMVSNAIMADSDETIYEILQTSKHNIEIVDGGNDTCIYRVWNKPKQIGQGQPDLEIADGTMWGRISVTDIACMKGAKGYDFKLKNVEIHITMDDCPEKGRPKNAIGTLDVSINGKNRSRYWIYTTP